MRTIDCSALSPTNNNSEYEKMFIRYMNKEHPVEAQQVIFDSSPASIRTTKIFADIFMSQEVVPRQKDLYLAYGRWPALRNSRSRSRSEFFRPSVGGIKFRKLSTYR